MSPGSTRRQRMYSFSACLSTVENGWQSQSMSRAVPQPFLGCPGWSARRMRWIQYGGRHFDMPRRITGDVKPARAPSLGLDYNRVLYLAWTSGDDDAADIHIAISKDGGTRFDRPCLVAPDKAYADAPKLMVSPDGILHLVYAQSSGGPFEKYHIRYTRSTGGYRFEAPSTISIPLPAGANSAAFPSLAMDTTGRIFVLFELSTDVRKGSSGLGITQSMHGGNHFSKPYLVPHSADPAGGRNGSQQGLLKKKLAVNGTGKIAVVNSSFNLGKASRIWLMSGSTKPACHVAVNQPHLSCIWP